MEEITTVIEAKPDNKNYIIFLSVIGIGIGLVLLMSRKKDKPKIPVITPIKYRTKTKIIVVDRKGEKLKPLEVDNNEIVEDEEEEQSDDRNIPPTA